MKRKHAAADRDAGRLRSEVEDVQKEVQESKRLANNYKQQVADLTEKVSGYVKVVVESKVHWPIRKVFYNDLAGFILFTELGILYSTKNILRNFSTL